MTIEINCETDGLEAVINNLGAAGSAWDDAPVWEVGAEAEYAVYVEMGTYKMPANRALRDSIEDTMSSVDQFFAQAEDIDEFVSLLAEDIADGYRSDVWVDTGYLRDSIYVSRIG